MSAAEAPTPTSWADARDRVARELDVIMFTVLRFTDGGATMERVWSSHPVEYPVGGTKDVATQVSPEWTAVSRDAGVPFLMPTPTDIERVFGDSGTILGLGIGALMNVPLLDDGHVVGSISISGPEESYTDADLARAAELLAGAETLLPTEGTNA